MLKKRFRIALSNASLTQIEWARRNNITRGALTNLLNGRMKSKRLTIIVESFIREEFRKLPLVSGSDVKAA